MYMHVYDVLGYTMLYYSPAFTFILELKGESRREIEFFFFALDRIIISLHGTRVHALLFFIFFC